eukprot:3215727-Rhodomonas_salina.1
MPKDWGKAESWARKTAASKGASVRCQGCRIKAKDHLLCSDCGEGWCRRCVEVESAALWEVSFTCTPCTVDSLAPASEGATRTHVYRLAQSMLQTKGAALKQGTWLNYQ